MQLKQSVLNADGALQRLAKQVAHAVEAMRQQQESLNEVKQSQQSQQESLNEVKRIPSDEDSIAISQATASKVLRLCESLGVKKQIQLFDPGPEPLTLPEGLNIGLFEWDDLPESAHRDTWNMFTDCCKMHSLTSF